MDTYLLKWTHLEHEVFLLLSIHAGEKLSQREIAKILKMSPTTVSNCVINLKDIVNIEKTKTINFISLNRDDKKAIQLKRAENFRNIYIFGLADYLEQELPGSTILLFGSYSLGEDTLGSDIDIAVIGRKEKELSFDKYEKLFQRKVNVNFYGSWKKINENLKNNILNGIVIHGSVEL